MKRFLEATSHASIVMNEISSEQITIARAQNLPSNWPRLFFKQEAFPHLDIENESLNAVLVHRFLHFFNGQDVDTGLQNIYRWLKKDGRIFIAVNTPYNKDYRDWFLPEYERKLAAGDLWPGVGLEVAKALPNQAYALPQTLHVMEARVLERALVKAGFKILQCDYISMQRFQSAEQRDGKEVLGIVAVKI